MGTLFGDPVLTAVERSLQALITGERLPEHRLVDYKEERGRRDHTGSILPGQARDDAVARQLAEAAACFANSGGGALIVGVADDGTLIGATIDAEWLRQRIYELTDRKLTVNVSETTARGMRLLVIQSPSALEPVRFRGKILWRMNDRCVEVDAAGWHATQMARRGYDWSAEESTIAPSAVRPGALDVARTFLRQSGEQHAINLANSQDPELLRRLNVVTHDELLTNAGVLAFVGRGNSAIDYIRRDLPGGDSIQRLRPEGASLLEEVAHVDQAMRAHVRRQHLGGDLVRGQVEELPLDVIREAVVNGIVHRDWAAPAPTVVEHTGSTLTVVSPGGFVGGITPSNIITHPSTPRYQSLAELFAALRIAEREGIGVDRMVGGMLRLGHHAPVIEEKQGPTVRTALVGGVVDEAWLNWLRRMEPEPSQDLQVLMLIRHLVDHGWVDVDAAHRLLQVTPVEAHAALLRAETVELDNSIPCVVPIKGTPSESQPGFTLSKEARKILDASERRQGWRATAPTLTPRAVALDWARHRGRVSSTELASIMGASHTNMSRYLRELEDEGLLEPSRPSRAGRGFYYRWSGDSDTK